MNGEGEDRPETVMETGNPTGPSVRERVKFYSDEFSVAQVFAKRLKEELEKNPKFEPCIVRQFCEIMVR